MFVILKKFHDYRLTQSNLINLQSLMKLFPSKNFFDHFIIIRTYADKNARIFENNKKQMKGKFVECLKDKEFSNFRKFIENNNIRKLDLSFFESFIKYNIILINFYYILYLIYIF